MTQIEHNQRMREQPIKMEEHNNYSQEHNLFVISINIDFSKSSGGN